MPRARLSVLLVLATCALVTGAGCGSGEPAVLRTDGLYRTGPTTSGNATYWRYLRFFEDGTAVSASSTGDAQAVARWLDASYEAQGSWTREDDRIALSIEASRGRIDYEGEVLADGLLLSFHSLVNDNRGESRYEFVPLPPPAGVDPPGVR